MYRLDLLKQVAARLAIQEPARSKGVDFNKIATDLLIDDLRTIQVQRPDGTSEKRLGLYIEPVQLQVVCSHLWERLPDDAQVIDESFVDARGGDVDAALAGYYADRVSAIAGGDRGKERRIRIWFEEHLITEFGLRGHVFLAPHESAGLDNTTVNALVKAHLVRAETHGSSWYELAHDRLVGPVKSSNARWRQEHLNEFQRLALTWAGRGRPADLLSQGQSLRKAEEWVEREKDLTPVEEAYLAASRQAEHAAKLERDRRQAQKRLRWLLVGLVLATSFYGWMLYLETLNQRRLTTSRELAAMAMNQLDGDSNRALELAVRAADPVHTFEAESALHSALAASQVRRLWSVAVRSGNAVAFSPGGRYLAVTGEASETELWEARTGKRLARLSGHQEVVTSVAFSADGRYIATGDLAGRVVLHARLFAYEHYVTLPDPPHGEGINNLAFSPDGTLLAAATDAPEPILWEVNAVGRVRRRPTVGVQPSNGAEKDQLLGLAFSFDGRFLVTGGSDGRVVLWDAAAQRLRPLKLLTRVADPVTRKNQPVDSVQFCPKQPALSATQLAFGTDNGAVWLWKLKLEEGRGRGTGRILFTHTTGPILGLAFSHAGDYLASSSYDRTAKVWDLSAARELFRLGPSSGPMGGIAVDPAGELIATSSRAPFSLTDTGIGAIEVWRVLFHDEVPQRSPGDFQGHIITASYVGTSLVAVSSGGSRIRWGGETRPVVDAGCLSTGANPVAAATFSPSGTHLTCTSEQGDVAIIATADGRVIRFRRPGTITAAYHAAQGILATADREGQVELWTQRGLGWYPKPRWRSPVPVQTLAFSPSGDRLAVGRRDGITLVLDAASDKSPVELRRHQGAVIAVAFSPDGMRVATGSSDLTAKLWDLARRVEVATFQGHLLPVSGVAFTPYGEALATVDTSGIARIEPLAIDKLLNLARDRMRPLPPRSDATGAKRAAW
jgi:WD40 repeat protein